MQAMRPPHPRPARWRTGSGRARVERRTAGNQLPWRGRYRVSLTDRRVDGAAAGIAIAAATHFPRPYLYDQIFTYLTARPAGELSEFSGGPPIVCSTWLIFGATPVGMRMFSGDPVTTSLLRLVNCLPS